MTTTHVAQAVKHASRRDSRLGCLAMRSERLMSDAGVVPIWIEPYSRRSFFSVGVRTPTYPTTLQSYPFRRASPLRDSRGGCRYVSLYGILPAQIAAFAT